MLHGADLLARGDLPAFAAANGWTHTPTADPPALGGGLWEQVSGGTVRDRIAGPGWEAGRIVGGTRTASSVEEKGGWTVTTSVTVSVPERSIDIGYLAVALPRRMPHLVLDARDNDRGPFSSLLNRPADDQRLSLEGDFDRHFRLYVPDGYGEDALYVFTPDLMALLIDEAGDLDVEIRDDRLIVSRPGGLDLHDPATWERFERIRRVLGAKAWDRTVRYADDRVPELRFGVDAGGRRLRRRPSRLILLAVGIPLGALALAGVVVAVVLGVVLR